MAEKLTIAGDWVLVTRLDFGDRVEGQCLHRGSRESCDATAKLISAVSISNGCVPKSAGLSTMPYSAFDIEPGQRYRFMREEAGNG